MQVSKVERQVNLVICLLSTRRHLPASAIRELVHGYDRDGEYESFKRMFERDKNELRGLGVPISVDRELGSAEEGYRILRRQYELPPIAPDPEEAAAIALAAQLSYGTSYAYPARNALTKLAGVVLSAGTEAAIPVTAGSGRDSSAAKDLEILLTAVDTGRPVRFTHRPSPTAEPARRVVEPWGVVARRGTWYLAGHDRDRDEIRTFRVSRMSAVAFAGSAGTVTPPEGVDPAVVIDEAVRSVEDRIDARIKVAPGRGNALRHAAADSAGDELLLRDQPRAWLLRELAALGADAHVLAPEELRVDLQSLWQRILDAPAPPAVSADGDIRAVDVGGDAAASGRTRPFAEPEPRADQAPAGPAPGDEDTGSRLARLLNLVPFLTENPGISAPRAAAALGVSVPQLMTDLRQLWMCGLPGYTPGDLIDLRFSFESIEVVFDAGIERPLRLSPMEAATLLVALDELANLPGLIDPGVVRRAMARIRVAAGIPVEPDAPEVADATPGRVTDPAIGRALRERRALRLQYYSESTDAVSDRVVDPVELVSADGRTYLSAHCRTADGMRSFRLDRIESVELLDEPARPAAAPPAEAPAAVAVLHLAPAVAWLLEYHPLRVRERAPDGGATVEMDYRGTDWATRFLLGLGADVTIVTPPELDRARRESACQALAAHGG